MKTLIYFCEIFALYVAPCSIYEIKESIIQIRLGLLTLLTTIS